MVRLIAALIGAALFVAAVAMVLWVLVATAAVYGLFWLGWRLLREYRAWAAARVHNRAELLARAELQHRWFLDGDPRGTYGRFRQQICSMAE
jgi:hypothetical protein